MDIIQTQAGHWKRRQFWILPYIFVAAGLLFSFIGLSEFYNIEIAGKESAYPFGQINENAWYYQTGTTYANYNLTGGFLFLLSSLITVWATIRKNGKALILGISVTMVLIVTDLLSSKVQ